MIFVDTVSTRYNLFVEQKHVHQIISRCQHTVRAASQGDMFPVRAKYVILTRCETEKSHVHVEGSGSLSSELTRPFLPQGPWQRWVEGGR